MVLPKLGLLSNWTVDAAQCMLEAEFLEWRGYKLGLNYISNLIPSDVIVDLNTYSCTTQQLYGIPCTYLLGHQFASHPGHDELHVHGYSLIIIVVVNYELLINHVMTSFVATLYS